MKNTPDKVQLTIKAEERLSPDMLGIELGVKILDQSSEPVSGQPFEVHADSEFLFHGMTDERGEFSGQRVLTVREGTQRKVFLVLEGSAVSDWKVVGNQKYVFGARMQDFTTTVKLPSHNLQIDENTFLRLLAGCTAMSLSEKLAIIDTFGRIPQSRAEGLIQIFSQEFTCWKNMSARHPESHQDLKDLEDKAEADWRTLERMRNW